MNLSQVPRDLLTAFTRLPSLPLVLGIIPPFKSAHSEINPDSYNGYLEYADMLGDAFIPKIRAAKPDIEPVGTNHFAGEKWFFLNGICTNESMWSLNAAYLSGMFQQRIHPLYNPTYGVHKDLAECIMGRTFNIKADVTKRLSEQLLEDVRDDSIEKIVIIAHSQGGIISSNLLNNLHCQCADEVEAKVELYTFASAADENDHDFVTQEHFANTLDYVAQIGVIHHEEDTNGQLYTAHKSGHLLNMHYLPHFLDGEYCDKKSQLHAYYQRTRPQN